MANNLVNAFFDSTYWAVADVLFHASDTLQGQSLRKELEQSI